MEEIYKFLDKAQGITSDSRKVKTGYVFVAYSGVSVDGHNFIQTAVEKGAVVVVGERDLELSVPYVKVDNARLALAKMWARWYGNPEKNLMLIGVTGTDGKTTTATIIYEILKSSGIEVGLISTVSARVGANVIETGLHTTTPDPDMFFMLLKKMVDAKCKYVVVETTSHALVQHRDGEVSYEIGVLTNLASEHLDLHGDIETYAEAKSRLFKRSLVSLINELSDWKEYFANASIGKVLTYNPMKEIRRTSVLVKKEKMIQRFELRYLNRWVRITSELPGRYNQENILASAKVTEAVGVDGKSFARGVSSVKQVRGRFELVKNSLGLHIVVDFAHTDQAIRNILSVVNKDFKGSGMVITVFGCIGERGQSKRAPMGKEACLLSDRVIVTMDDPRKESMSSIFSEIEVGCKEAGGVFGVDYFRIDDRENAIREAILSASPGDWVMILGKGHEQSINIKGKELPWDDVKVVKKILKENGRKS